MTSYSGFLVASPAAHDFGLDDLECRGAEGARYPSFRHVRDRVYNIHRWDEYLLTTSSALLDEPKGQESYAYQVYVVRGYAKLVLLAQRRRVIDFLLAQVFDRRIFPNLRKVAVFVTPLVEHCRQSEAEFLVTSINARISGSATHLKTIALWGDEVTQSPVYVDHHRLFNLQSAGLGRRLHNGLPRVRSEEGGEIVRLGNDGFVNINLSTRQQADELLNVINFVMLHRWVEDWVPLGKTGAPWPT